MNHRCWCGNANLTQWNSDYYRCDACDTLISRYISEAETEGQFCPENEQEDIYGANYWEEEKLNEYRKMQCTDLDDALLLHYRERAGLWLSAIMQHILPPSTVLEVGCGLGSLMRWMQDLGYTTRALELSYQWTEHLRREVGIQVDTHTLHPPQAGECKLDVIIIMDVLEHVSDTITFMENIRDHLNEDGILCLQTPRYPLKASFSWLQKTNNRFIRHLNAHEHLILFSESSIKRLTHEMGFIYTESYPALGVDDMFYIFSKKPLKRYSPLQIKKQFMSSPSTITAYAAYISYLHLAALKLQNENLVRTLQEILASTNQAQNTAQKEIAKESTLNFKPLPLPYKFSQRTVKKILYVRLDGIGDTILANALLEHLPTAFPNAQITVACDAAVASIYESTPVTSNVLPLNKFKLSDPTYLKQCTRLLRSVGADIVLHGTRSPTMPVAALCLSLNIPVMGLQADAINMTEGERDFYNEALACQWSTTATSELAAYREILSNLGVTPPTLQARIWLSKEAQAEANDLWKQIGFKQENTIAIFCGGSSTQHHCAFIGKALAPTCVQKKFSVVALGSHQEYDINEKNIIQLQKQGIQSINLSGRCNFLTSTAFLASCRCAIGVDTSLAHAAAALNVPHVVILSGTYIGRFLPSSPKTVALCLPLECAGCDNKCRYKEPFCLTGIKPEFLTQAIERASSETWPNTGAGRLMLQPPLAWQRIAGLPRWRSPQTLIKQQEMLPVEERISIITLNRH